jgi:hypothetical protein
MKKKPKIVRIIRSKKGKRPPEYIGIHDGCDGLRYKVILYYDPLFRGAALAYCRPWADVRKIMASKRLNEWMDFPYEE